jgi:AmmeMemoRadiSam system protein B
MAASTPDSFQPAPEQPKFDSSAPHMQRPKVRQLRGFPVEGTDPSGKKLTMLGLADARQISEKMVVTAPAVQTLIPLMDGSRGIDDIVTQIGHGLNRPIMEGLVAQLDDAGLLEGPTFQALLEKSREEFDSTSILPPGGTAQFADLLVMQAVGKDATEEQKAERGPAKLREIFDLWMAEALKEAPKPSFDQLPKAIVAPHIDYQRGWVNYAHVYGRLRVCDRPDRIVILGTNHFGMGTGVVGCDKGYESPLGVCNLDDQLADLLREKLGEKLFEHRFDHEREHSIELHIPWIQHIFGKDEAGEYPSVMGVLVHDPAMNNGESYDGKGVGIDPFATALKQSLAALEGKTLIISSCDLSHCGPAFGDPQPLAGETEPAQQARNKIVQHDLQMLDMVVKNKPSELIASMAWQQNPTRWCSTGNLVATLKVVEPKEVELLNYAAAMDQQGITWVSSAAMAMR